MVRGMALIGHQEVVGLIPVWALEIVLLRIELDERSSIIQDISKLHISKIYIFQK